MKSIMKSKRQWMATNRLKTMELFGALFPRSESMIDAIAGHMTENGYDESQPIVVWDRTKEEGSRHAFYVVDGHTRKCAAAKSNLSPVYVARMKFPDEETALEYAIHNQRDRRNIIDADLLRCIEAVDKRKPRGGDRKSKAAKSKSSTEPIENVSSAKITADIVGTSETKVKKARKIIDSGDDEIKQAVLNGDVSIHRASNEIPSHLKCERCGKKKAIMKNDSETKWHGCCPDCLPEFKAEKKTERKEKERAKEKAKQEWEKLKKIPITLRIESEVRGLEDSLRKTLDLLQKKKSQDNLIELLQGTDFGEDLLSGFSRAITHGHTYLSMAEVLDCWNQIMIDGEGKTLKDLGMD